MSRLSQFVPILRAALIVAVIAFLALTLAYQVRSRWMLDVGAPRDELFVRDFFGAEGDATQNFRWTRRNSEIELQGQQLAAPWIVRMYLNGYRPDRPASIDLAVNDVPFETFQAHGDWSEYEFQGNVGSDFWNGTTTLRFASDFFVPQNFDPNNSDTRRLGVAVDWVEIEPARSAATVGDENFWLDLGRAPIAPPLWIGLSYAVAFGILYATARGIGLSARAVNVGAGILICFAALGIAFARFYLAPFATAFFILAITLAVLACALMWFLPRAAKRLALEWDARSATLLCAIVLLSIALKWGGVWFPNFRSSDLLFHAHRLAFVASGNLFFTSELPDAARRVVPYPPALYVTLAPFTLFTREYENLLLVAGVLCDALAILAIYFAARKISTPQSPVSTPQSPVSNLQFALFAAFLFAFNPVTFWIYSWGNHTNIFGELAATLLFCLLLTQSIARPRNFLLALFCMVVAATAHLGIFLSLLAFFPIAFVLRLLTRDENSKREALAWLLLFGGGIMLAGILYYAEFAEPLFAQTQKFVNDFGAGRAAGDGITWKRISDVARLTGQQLGWVLLATGVAGIPLARKIFSARARSIWLAWLLVTLLFGAVTLGSTFSTRYTLWAVPALALSGGLVLAWLFKKSRATQFAAYALCALAFAQTLWLWVDRVLFAYQ